MLTRLRPLASRVLGYLAKPLAFLPADFYTATGLLLAVVYLVACLHERVFLGFILLLLSGFFDALDGFIARVRGEASPRGAFLDSFVDRVADSMYAMGFLLLGYNMYTVYLMLTGSLLVSYARARFESLTGKGMEGLGVMERSDRTLALAFTLLVHSLGFKVVAGYMFTIITVLVWFTVLQRFIKSYTLLSRS